MSPASAKKPKLQAVDIVREPDLSEFLRDEPPAFFGPMGKGEILDLTPEQYHTDPFGPSLSSSIAKLVVDRSPAHAFAAHPKLGGQPRITTPDMDAGTLQHHLLLGKGADIVEILADSYRTDAAKEARDEAKKAGKFPVLAETLAEAKESARELGDSLAELGFVLHGRSEVCVRWKERVFASEAEIECRAMLDHVFLEQGVIWDIKKCASAHPDDCMKAIARYGYHLQHAAYTSALRHLIPGISGREDFVFLFVEDSAPYAVTPVRLDGQFRALGEARWERAKKLWHESLTTKVWPAYTTEPVYLSPPPWAMAGEAL